MQLCRVKLTNEQDGSTTKAVRKERVGSGMRSDSVIPVGIRQIESCVVAVTGTRKLVVRYQRTKRKGEKGKERVTNPLTSVTYLVCMIRALHVTPGLSMATYLG